MINSTITMTRIEQKGLLLLKNYSVFRLQFMQTNVLAQWIAIHFPMNINGGPLLLLSYFFFYPTDNIGDENTAIW